MDSRPLANRVLERCLKGEVDGCWTWKGRPAASGYGRILVAGRSMLAHRASYQAFVGAIPDGLYVLHQCDNRICVNPRHLYVGTHEDNMRDMAQRGRAARTNCKLCESDARLIRRLYAAGGCTQRELADRFGVNQGTIGPLLRGQTWRSA